MVEVQCHHISGYQGEEISDSFPWGESWPTYAPDLFGRLIVRDLTADAMVADQWLLVLADEEAIGWSLPPEITGALDTGHRYRYRVEVGADADSPLVTVREGDIFLYPMWTVTA